MNKIVCPILLSGYVDSPDFHLSAGLFAGVKFWVADFPVELCCCLAASRGANGDVRGLGPRGKVCIICIYVLSISNVIKAVIKSSVSTCIPT